MQYRKYALLFMTVLGLLAFAGCKGKETSEAESTEAGSTEYVYEYSKGLTDFGYLEGITAKDYIDFDAKDIVIERSEIDSLVNQNTESLWNYIGTSFPSKITDRAIENGDRVNINYSGSVDGVKFSGGTAENQEVTAGSNEFIDDFLTQIIGHKAGETFDIHVSFPDPYPNNPDLAGKPSVFEVTINYIVGTPDFSDAFITENNKAIGDLLQDAKLAEIKTKTEMDDYFYKVYEKSCLESAINNAINGLELKKEVPESVKQYVTDLIDYTYYTQTKMHINELIDVGYISEEQVETTIDAQIVSELVYQWIYENEGYQVTEEQYSEITGKEDNSETIAKTGKGYIARWVMNSRAMDWLLENVTITEE